MQRENLLQALHACRAQQPINRQREVMHESTAVSKCPEIGVLLEQRKQAIMQGLQNAMSGIVQQKLPEETLQRSERIRTLLIENGFPEDYLDPIYTCSMCRDTGYTGEYKKEFCTCVLQHCQQLTSQTFAMPQTEETFEGYDITVFSNEPLPGLDITQQEYALVLRKRCEDYANQLPRSQPPNLLFYGRSGLGKTYLLRAIAQRAQEKGISTLSVTANTPLNAMRKFYFSHEAEGMALFYDTQLLLIDDLGTEPMWENITVEQLFALLDARFSSGKNTVISTNLTLTELQARYTERIASRLTDVRLCQSLRFLGDDIRKRREP